MPGRWPGFRVRVWGSPSVHVTPSPNLLPEPREIELVQISEASRKERPQVLIPSLGEGTRRQKPSFACRRSRCALKVLRFSVWAVPGPIISLSARTGPLYGPMQAFSAIFACTGPRLGPIQAL